jgi:hypothetical protein
MATAGPVSYSVPDGGLLRAGLFDPAMTGGITLDAMLPTGALASNVSTLAGSLLLDDALPTGSIVGPTPIPTASIVNISQNHRDSVNPRSNAALNPSAPSAAPWEASVGWGSEAISAYAGALYASGMGDSGIYLMYAAPGHSTNLEYCGHVGFNIATRLWEIVDNAPPTPVMSSYSAGVTPAPSRFNHDYGDWIGDSADWALAFRRPGYNPPAGAHTRNSWVYIPGAQAGNSRGKVVTAWHPTGNNTGTGLRGSWVYDCDTRTWSRTANLRPGDGSSVGGVAYHAAQNVVVGYNRESSAVVAELDVLDMATLTWTRRNATGAVALAIDSTCFIVGDLYVYVGNGAASSTMRAAPVSTVKAGGSWTWQNLTLSASSWPIKVGGVAPGTFTCQWSRCPVNGAWYAVNRNAGSQTLWRLDKPAGVADSDTSGLLSGTWTVASETLTGAGLEPAQFDYGRLQWCSAITAFLWVGDAHTSNVQAIRPVGV